MGRPVVLDQVGLWTSRVEGWDDPCRDLGAQRRDQDPGRHGPQPGLHRGQPLFEPRPPSAPRRPATTPPTGAAARARRCPPASRRGPAGGRAGRRRAGRDGRATARANWSAPSADFPIFCDRRAPCSPPGTSSSRAPRARRTTRRAGTWTSGTFDSSHERLEAAAAMGFDVVYLPPIHPIGTAFRKGRNNTLDPGAVRSRVARGRSAPPRAGTTRSIPISATSSPSTGSWPRPSRSGWRSPSTWRCRPRPTTPG